MTRATERSRHQAQAINNLPLPLSSSMEPIIANGVVKNTTPKKSLGPTQFKTPRATATAEVATKIDRNEN